MATKTTAPAPSSTDRIETRVEVRASRGRVWRAIANAEEFSVWFRMAIDGAFAPQTTVRARLTVPGYEHVSLDLQVEQIQPERYFSYRWHPAALEAGVDYSAEPTTLVEFRLEEIPDGTAVTIVESGFDGLPVARRADAYRMNNQGWTGQVKNLVRHVA